MVLLSSTYFAFQSGRDPAPIGLTPALCLPVARGTGFWPIIINEVLPVSRDRCPMVENTLVLVGT
jgi:hypothetical protein